MSCGRSVVFSGTLDSSTNRTDHHYVTEIVLKVALNTITLTSNPQMGIHGQKLYYAKLLGHMTRSEISI